MYLHIGHPKQEFSVQHAVDLMENFSYRQGNDARLFWCASHCVCLAAGSLPISKHCAIETSNDLPRKVVIENATLRVSLSLLS